MRKGITLSEEAFARITRVVEWAEAHLGRENRAAPPPLSVEPDIARVTGPIDGDGNYPAVITYWDGSAWTEHVSRAGQQYRDPPVP